MAQEVAALLAEPVRSGNPGLPYEFVIAVADGSIDDVGEIAAVLAPFAAGTSN